MRKTGTVIALISVLGRWLRELMRLGSPTRRSLAAQKIPVSNQNGRPLRRRGFTLLEVMIATAVTLLMMLGLAQMFKVLGDSINRGRTGLELNNRLRSVMHRIRTDLDHVTAMPRPPLPVGAGQGYMKIYDGPMTDYTFADDRLRNRYGDLDDIFMATVKAKDTWFTGKVPAFIVEGRAPDITDLDNLRAELSNTVTIASEFAEVVMFVQPFGTDADGNPTSFRLHYRTLLIRPDLNDASTGRLLGQLSGPAFNSAVADALGIPFFPAAVNNFDLIGCNQICDLSVRKVGTNQVAANSLEDLAKPGNRFAHIVFQIAPNILSMPVLALSPSASMIPSFSPSLVGEGFLDPAFVLAGDRQGEDILATDVLAFDIRCYDSSAPIVEFEGLTLRPGDPGFGTVAVPAVANTVAHGDFVDLNWAGKLGLGQVSELSGVTAAGVPTNSLFRSGLVKGNPPNNYQIYQPAYDTFTDYFEQDGVLQAELAGNNRGLVTVLNPGSVSLREPWRATAIDAGRDGIDNRIGNNGPAFGIDDISEMESSPPFPVNLRGVQITVRLEDRSSKQFKQMSTVKEFVTN